MAVAQHRNATIGAYQGGHPGTDELQYLFYPQCPIYGKCCYVHYMSSSRILIWLAYLSWVSALRGYPTTPRASQAFPLPFNANPAWSKTPCRRATIPQDPRMNA